MLQQIFGLLHVGCHLSYGPPRYGLDLVNLLKSGIQILGADACAVIVDYFVYFDAQELVQAVSFKVGLLEHEAHIALVHLSDLLLDVLEYTLGLVLSKRLDRDQAVVYHVEVQVEAEVVEQ